MGTRSQNLEGGYMTGQLLIAMPQMEDARFAPHRRIEILQTIHRVRAGIAIEADVFAPVSARGDKRDGGARIGSLAKVRNIHAFLTQSTLEPVAKRVFAHLTDETCRDSQLRQPDRDIGRRAARRFQETLRFR